MIIKVYKTRESRHSQKRLRPCKIGEKAQDDTMVKKPSIIISLALFLIMAIVIVSALT